MTWYQLSVKEIFKNLKTSEHGLSEDEVRNRLEKYGPNKLAEEERVSMPSQIL